MHEPDVAARDLGGVLVQEDHVELVVLAEVEVVRDDLEGEHEPHEQRGEEHEPRDRITEEQQAGVS